MIITRKGVELRDLRHHVSMILKIIEQTYFEAHQPVVIIGTKWGHDKARAAHEMGHAVDIMLPIRKPQPIIDNLRVCLGLNYVVEIHDHHAHVEHWPLSMQTSGQKRKAS